MQSSFIKGISILKLWFVGMQIYHPFWQVHVWNNLVFLGYLLASFLICYCVYSIAKVLLCASDNTWYLRLRVEFKVVADVLTGLDGCPGRVGGRTQGGRGGAWEKRGGEGGGDRGVYRA